MLPSDSAVVRLSGVEKRFAVAGASTAALSGIDLAIQPGEFVSLIGPSGCGKSTLLRIIGDLIKPSAGSVEVNGKPAARARHDRDYGMVFQAPVLFDWRTIEGNVELPLEVMGVARDERRCAVEPGARIDRRRHADDANSDLSPCLRRRKTGQHRKKDSHDERK